MSANRLISEVQLFHIRVATAESELKVLREHARQARRRHKEAKRFARQARRQFKRSRAELSELKRALARAEARLFKASGRTLARKVPKPITRSFRTGSVRRKKPAINRAP